MAMHNREPIDDELVKVLLAEQFPRWSHLPLERIKSHGTDNAIYRLGLDMCVRLPKVDWAAKDAEKEQKLLLQLGDSLPLVLPLPLAMGGPTSGYPWHWSIYRWIDGENACDGHLDLNQAAHQMADFLRALRQVEPTCGKPCKRGLALVTEDHEVQQALSSLKGEIDTDQAQAIWAQCLKAPLWDGPSTWLHGDLLPGNLLVNQGKLSAVIDWGLSGIGDPACDMMVAYSLFDADSRKTFRNLMAVDDAMWTRGLGWALSIALIILPYYWDSNPKLASIAKRMIREVLKEAADTKIIG